MKKLAVVFGVAAVATFTGCKDPDYVGKKGQTPQDEVKTVETKPAEVTTTKKVEATTVTTTEITTVEPKCLCAPGTKHTSPCTCGARDCTCVVVKPQPAAEYTVYIVQNGDYLAKISKKFNVTIGSIKRLNNMKSDTIRVGQKLKLPGKVDVAAQATTAATTTVAANKKTVKKGNAPYVGATKEYVVKSGDTLGSVAYGNGINIRQLKQLNGLTGDTLKVGQKLKVPTEKPVAAKKTDGAAKKTAAVEVKKAQAEVKQAEVAVKQAEVEVKQAEVEAKQAEVEAKQAEVAVKEAESAPAAPATTTYVVQEGEDLTRLAVDFGVTPTVIRELNNLGENDTIKPGQVLKLPAEAQQ